MFACRYTRYAQNTIALEVRLQAGSQSSLNVFLVLNLLFEREVSLKDYCKLKSKVCNLPPFSLILD